MKEGRSSVRILNSSYIERDKETEERIGIEDISLFVYKDTDGFTIIGQLFAEKIEMPFSMKCVVYDKDGDIIFVEENSSYGSGWVNNGIYPESFFRGYPFELEFDLPSEKPSRIKLVFEI